MTDFDLSLILFAVLMVLILLRAPIGLAMLVCGAVGLYMVTGSWSMFLAKLKTESYSIFSNHSLSIIPMFLLMGQFATHSGLSRALFKAAEGWFGHYRGGLAIAAIGACGGFGAICGSSLATAATMGRVALPELEARGYKGGLATATLAAGGTLGILIPPSIILVIYAILTEQNIAKLFLAAFIPGLMAAVGYALAIMLYVRLYPNAGGSTTRRSYAKRFQLLFEIWPAMIIFVMVVGGIYMGIFTPTEGAAIGAALTCIFTILLKKMNFEIFKQSLFETAKSTAMIFFIILGAAFFNGFLALSQFPQTLSIMIIETGLSPWLILVLILCFYLVFGCIMDSLSMILLTVPIFFPIIMGLDFGLSPEQLAIWFGILILIAVEVGLITPPVGMNLFIINNLSPKTPLMDTYKAVLFFVGSDIIRIALLLLFPSITLMFIA
ncbi:MAG: TRAP transporter large permease [Alphaproteobacteria bacterium]